MVPGGGLLASKLRATVAAVRTHAAKPPAAAPDALQAVALAKRAAIAASMAGGGGMAVGPPRAIVNALSSDDERRRADDIARSVDYLKVLNGEKKKLGPSETGHVAFYGGGAKLGNNGSEDAGPSRDLYKGTGGPKKVVTADGKVVVARGASDAAAERERRASAALARLSQVPQN